MNRSKSARLRRAIGLAPGLAAASAGRLTSLPMAMKVPTRASRRSFCTAASVGRSDSSTICRGGVSALASCSGRPMRTVPTLSVRRAEMWPRFTRISVVCPPPTSTIRAVARSSAGSSVPTARRTAR